MNIRYQAILPGVSVSVITGLAALFLSDHYGSPAMLFALLIGMAVSFLYRADSPSTEGIDFCASTLLRTGVVLLGLRLALEDLTALGWDTLGLLCFAVLTTILLGIGLAKIFGLKGQLGALTGGAVAICGASAALAISTILPKGQHHERDTLVTVIGVTAMSTIAMVLYPIIDVQLNLSDSEAGIFLGGTIHDVAQVVGAGYSISQEVGDMATLTKLVRVAMLVPVVMIMVLVVAKTLSVGIKSRQTNSPKIPLFLVGFVMMMLVNSFFVLPESVVEVGSQISRFFLIVSIAAIGMKSNLGQLINVGVRPIIMIFAETLWLALIILGYLHFS